MNRSRPSLWPVLRPEVWDIPTAINLACFSALAYAENDPVHPGSIAGVVATLSQGDEPRLFGTTPGTMVLGPAPQGTVPLPRQESQLGVNLFLAADARQAVIFIQGTNNLLTAALDSIRTRLQSHRIHKVRSVLETRKKLLRSSLDKVATLGGTNIIDETFFAHKTAILEFLAKPENRGAHLGFMMVTGAFLHSVTFQQLCHQASLTEKELFFTGHSLGGALALLLARELQPVCARPITVYTFGCPRVGSKAFVRTIPRKIIHQRVVNRNDPVAWMASGYHWKDHGQLRFIHEQTKSRDREKQYRILPHPRRTMDWLPDHFIRQYIHNLWQALHSGSSSPKAQAQKARGFLGLEGD